MSGERYRALIHQLEHLAAQIDPTADFTYRFMFGGVGLYTRGAIFGTLVGLDDGTISIALKLPVEGREGLLTGESVPEPPGGRSYAAIPPGIADDDDRLIEWMAESMRYTWSLAVKRKRKEQ